MVRCESIKRSEDPAEAILIIPKLKNAKQRTLVRDLWWKRPQIKNGAVSDIGNNSCCRLISIIEA